MSVESIAQKWHDQFLRTDPIDHGSAETAMRRVYRLAGLPEPDNFLWCGSPLEAAWALLVLVGKTDSYNHAVYDDVARSESGRQKLAKAIADAAGRLGIGEGQVEGYIGKPFYRAEGTNPVSKALKDNYIEAIMARAQAGGDFLAIHSRGPFKPLHDLEQALFYEGQRMRGGKLRSAVLRDAMLKAGGKHVEILGGRSAFHRLYGSMAYSEIALDEALAETGRLETSELQRAMWAAYEACGMWWPCEAGIVFSERPSEAEPTGGGLSLRWADGFGFNFD